MAASAQGVARGPPQPQLRGRLLPAIADKAILTVQQGDGAFTDALVHIAPLTRLAGCFSEFDKPMIADFFPTTRTRTRLSRVCAFLVLATAPLAVIATAEVRLNEIMARTSQRLLAEDSKGRLRPGSGPDWIDPGSALPGWKTGSAPLGYGGATPLGTDLSAAMKDKAYSLYVRKKFAITPAQLEAPGQLRLQVNFDDGFVAYLNGREIARANAGPAGHYLYHDQPAYNFAHATHDETFVPADQPGTASVQPMVIQLGDSAARLLPGDNILAIQLHNREPGTSALIDAALDIAGDAPHTLLPFAASGWEYFVGLVEPAGGVFDPSDLDAPDSEPEFSDWIELANMGTSDVDLTGWSLTDKRNNLRMWTFPSGTSIPADGTLIVLADGRESAPGAAALHCSFSLSGEGEYLALVDDAAIVRDALDPGYPPQDLFHSYGRNEAGIWGYYREASPGAPNTGVWLPDRVAAPRFSLPGGFHSGAFALTLSSDTPDAVIRYTTNGTVPTPQSGIPYAGPITVAPLGDKRGTVITARAFKDGLLASAAETSTYLVDQAAHLRAGPAVVLSGDPGYAFYKPLGIFSIQGGAYASQLWVATTASDYNIPAGANRWEWSTSPVRPYERPVQIEFLLPDGSPGFKEGAGVRIASSRFSRPRLVFSYIMTSPLHALPQEKASLNLFFRNDYGTDELQYPLIPGLDADRFKEIRLRAGKNDMHYPFIRDELTRRLYSDLGHVSSVGSFVSLYLNGVYKGYYNMTQRIREPFLQTHHKSGMEWDVRYNGSVVNGDSDHFDTVLWQRLQSDLSEEGNYAALTSILDLVNAADYYLLNIFAATWDWPNNNHALARERSAFGKWRYYIWDAEGAFGYFDVKQPSYNVFTDNDAPPESNIGLLTGRFQLCRIFAHLATSEEWRLLFADRIQKHFFNDGALSDARLIQRMLDCKNEAEAIMGVTYDSDWFGSWLNPAAGRKRFLFPQGSPGEPEYESGHFRDPDQNGELSDSLWPLDPAPAFAPSPGEWPIGTRVTLGNDGSPDSVIYYTLDGTDPRLFGGAVSGKASVYGGPFELPVATSTLKARVKNLTSGAWSPASEAIYRVGTVPASADNIVVSQFMYHPPDPTPAEAAAGFTDPEDFEFLELLNIAETPVNLSELRFASGTRFDFGAANVRILDPGQKLLIGSNETALLQRYGIGITPFYAGTYSGNLSNSGEVLLLETSQGDVIKHFAYDDGAPWPSESDGGGMSLVLSDPSTNPDHGSPTHWVPSALPGGSPVGAGKYLDYAVWAAWTFSAQERADPLVSGQFADADGDGWSNMAEFVLASRAKDQISKPDTTWVRVDPAGDVPYLDLTFTKASTIRSMLAVPQFSVDLEEWSAGFALEEETASPDGRVTERWRLSIPPAPLRFFWRLVFTPPAGQD